MKWITDHTPDNEKEILILTERDSHYNTDTKKFEQTKWHEIVRGFYTDGIHNTEDSWYNWECGAEWDYDEEADGYIIPECYWEERYYGDGEDSIAIIDQRVIGWCYVRDAVAEALEQMEGKK